MYFVKLLYLLDTEERVENRSCLTDSSSGLIRSVASVTGFTEDADVDSCPHVEYALCIFSPVAATIIELFL